VDARLARGGIEAKEGPTQNVDLWRRLLRLASRFDLSYEYVPGHHRDPMIRAYDGWPRGVPAPNLRLSGGAKERRPARYQCDRRFRLRRPG
jgi:hypothetical protein